MTIFGDSAGVGPNPIDDTATFVTQHYRDFLSRDPDPPGLAGWTATINNCAGITTQCDRVHVSEAFFKSEEFQQRDISSIDSIRRASDESRTLRNLRQTWRG